MAEVFTQWNVYDFAPHPLHHDRVHRKGRPRHNDFVAGCNEGLHPQFEDFITAAAEDQLALTHAKFLGQARSQLKARTIGVSIHFIEARPQRFDRLGRRTDRVLVGCKLDRRRDAKFALEGFHGLARLVGSEIPNVGVYKIFDGHR